MIKEDNVASVFTGLNGKQVGSSRSYLNIRHSPVRRCRITVTFSYKNKNKITN